MLSKVLENNLNPASNIKQFWWVCRLCSFFLFVLQRQKKGPSHNKQHIRLQSINKLYFFTAKNAVCPQVFVQYREQLGKSSWLPLPTSVERVKLMRGDAWWVIALSTRPLVLLRGLVWSFIYTPFCSGFQNSFPSSLQSNYKARPPSMAGMLNKEKDHWFGCSLQKQSKKKRKNKREKSCIGLTALDSLLVWWIGWGERDSLGEKGERMDGWRDSYEPIL